MRKMNDQLLHLLNYTRKEYPRMNISHERTVEEYKKVLILSFLLDKGFNLHWDDMQ